MHSPAIIGLHYNSLIVFIDHYLISCPFSERRYPGWLYFPAFQQEFSMGYQAFRFAHRYNLCCERVLRCQPVDQLLGFR